MSEEYQTPIESQLGEWAQGRDYVFGPKIWRNEIRDATATEATLEEKTGPIAAHMPKGLSEAQRIDYIAKHASRGMEADVSVFKRHLLIPVGVIVYRFSGNSINRADDSLGTPERIKAYVESGKMHINGVEWYLGQFNDQWQSDKWPVDVRRQNCLLTGNMLLTYWGANKNPPSSTSGQIGLGWGESDDPFYNAIAAVLDWNEPPASPHGDLAKYIRRGRDEFGLFVTGDHNKDLGKLLVRLDKAIQSLS